MPSARDRLAGWIQETHSVGFELRRHFFLRFFDSELLATPGQWQVVAVGVLAVLLSFSLPYAQAYYHKYLHLHQLDEPLAFRLALLSDVLLVVTLAMLLIGLLTALLWPLLFPGPRDYLALASLPIRRRDLFAAKFTALVAFAGMFILATTLVPSLMLPAVMSGKHAGAIARQVPGIFVSSSLAALFVFFSLVAAQGLLLNVAPVRLFARVSLAAQGILVTVFLCGLPLALSIPSLQRWMSQRPDWVVWVPPFWFLGLDQVIVGNLEPLAVRLARLSLAGVAVAAAAAVATYLWSYRRYQVQLLESAAVPSPAAVRRSRLAALAERLIPDPRELAVFAFIAKTMTRSRQHRLVLTSFVALAVAVIFQIFVNLALSRTFRGFSVQTPALRQAAISVPLAFSLFVLFGLRYLFRLPVELRANWVFRLNEPGNRLAFLAAMRRFLLCFGVAPVALLTLPVEVMLLGPQNGIAAAILCLLASLALAETILIRFEKVPFTSAYLPGQRPVIQTLALYAVGVLLCVVLLSALIGVCLRNASSTVALLALFVAAWWKARRARREDWAVGKLEFEELPEPAVLTLGIERD